MERPTRERLEAAMQGSFKDTSILSADAEVLRAEVRALRVDARIYTRMELMLNEHMNGRTLEVWTHEHDQLLATLKRVEALPTKWRTKEFLNVVDHHATHECANELETALKGEP